MPATTSPFNQESDEVIWDSIRNNKKEALAVIYYRYFNLLLRRGLQITGERELVKDCIHDLFLEIWINKVNLSTPLSVRAYLTVSLQRKIYRKLRKIRLQRSEIDSLPVEHINSKEDQIISEQQINDQQYVIIRALDSLSRRQKEAIQLKFYAGMSYEEISGKMKISTDSIYNLISKAISNLHKGLTGKAEVTLY